MSRAKRSTTDYTATARKIAKLVPSVKKYKKRKQLTRWEKGAITRAEKKLKGLPHIRHLTEREARLLKDVLPAPGVRGIQLGNTGEDVKINVTERKDMFVTTNGRTWVYWQLSQLGQKEYDQLLDEGYSEEEALEYVRDENQQALRQAGEQAFAPTIREAFPVEKILRLAEKAFKKPHVHMIGLWADKGRVGEAFRNFDEFRRWVRESYSTYQNVERWVNGIAILIGERGEKVDASVWSNRNTKTIEEDRKKRRAIYRAEQRRKRRES